MTALQPPILNLNRLNISSGWPSDLTMSMLLQVLGCYSDKVRESGEMFPINLMSPAEMQQRRQQQQQQQQQHSQQWHASSDRLTPLIGWSVMGLVGSRQWESRVSGVMPRLSVERGIWLVRCLSKRETIPAQLKLHNYTVLIPVGPSDLVFVEKYDLINSSFFKILFILVHYYK